MTELNDTGGNKAKLFAKIAKVMAAVRTLPKDGKNKFDNYDYITGDSAFERVGGAMATAGIVALPSILEVTTTESPSQAGKTILRTVIHGQITLADGETGETWTSDWYGEGADRGDKSINKAMTAMMKYYLLRLFMVGSGDDADAESHDLTETKKTTQATTTQRSAPTPAGDTTKSAAFKSFMAQGTSLFNGEWDNARHWVIDIYTRKNTPDNVRTSANDLTDAELNTLAGSMKTSAKWFKTEWDKQATTVAA